MNLRLHLCSTLALAFLLLSLPARSGNEAPFLWQVQGDKALHYVAGSVHMLPESAYPLPPGLEAAYAATRGLVLEADLERLSSPELQGRLIGAARDDRPGGLKASIGDKLYRKLQARAAELGAPAPICDAFRAWFCSVTLELITLQRAGFSPELGIDQHFYGRAREDGRDVLGLETPEQQIDLFIGLPETMSVGMLAATLDELTADSQDPAELLRLWREGDVAAVEKMLRELRQSYPTLYARLVADRNRAWLPKLVTLFSGDKAQLVVVGAAHLPGTDGLLALLKSKGFELRPVGRTQDAPASRVAKK